MGFYKKRKKVLSVLLAFLLTLSLGFGNLAVLPVYGDTEGNDTNTEITVDENSSTILYQEVTDLEKISSSDLYVLVAWRYFGGTDEDSTKGYVFSGESGDPLRVNTTDQYKTITYEDNNGVLPQIALWKITALEEEEGYSIQNASTEKYVGSSTVESEEAVAYTFTQGTVNSCVNFALSTSGASIRYSGTSKTFKNSGSDGATESNKANACNFTIYKVSEQETVSPETQEGHKIFFASDYQGDPAKENLVQISGQIKNAGITPELAVWCGDYVDGLVYADGADVSPDDMAGKMTEIKDTMSGNWEDLQYLFLQGNHDYSGFLTDGTLTATGPVEYDDYTIYIINEDDFPWWQGVDSDYADSAKNKETVEKTAANLKTYLDAQIVAGSQKPIIICTHVPLSWSARSTTGTTWWMDNIYANIMFPVINEAARSLDIVYLYGHNHSDGYDNYIGGSIDYLGVGDVMRVPDGTNGTKNYTKELINFTYANAGYIGSVSSNLDPSISTASVFTITDDTISMDKYSVNGLYEDASKTITRFQYGGIYSAIVSSEDETRKIKEGEEDHLKLLTSGLEPVSYSWASESENVSFTSGTDAQEADVSYTAAGDAKITCTVTYNDSENQPQELTKAYEVTIDAATDTEGYEEITDLSLLEDGAYALVAWRYFGGTDSDSTKGYVLHSENDGALRVDTNDKYETITYEDGILPDTALWNITKVDEGYTIQNLSTGKYLGNSTFESDDPVTYTLTQGTCNGYTNFVLSVDDASLRYSGTSGTFSNSGSNGEKEAARSNACNFTIYQYYTPDVSIREYATPSVSYVGWSMGADNFADDSMTTFWNGHSDPNLEDSDQWAMYDFGYSKAKISSCTVNWYDDAGGVVVPQSILIEYENAQGEWQAVTPTNEWTYKDGNTEDDTNVYEFEPVVTSKIRMTMTHGLIDDEKVAVAVYNWDVMGKMISINTDPVTPEPEEPTPTTEPTPTPEEPTPTPTTEPTPTPDPVIDAGHAPKAVTNLKAKAAGTSVKLTWKKAEYADQYIIYRQAKGVGKFKKIKTVRDVASYTDKTVKSGTAYAYKIRGVNVANGLAYSVNGKLSAAVKIITKPAAVKITSLKKKAGKAELKFKKVTGSTTYYVSKYNTKTRKYQPAYKIEGKKVYIYKAAGKKYVKYGTAKVKKNVYRVILKNAEKGKYRIQATAAKKGYPKATGKAGAAKTLK